MGLTQMEGLTQTVWYSTGWVIRAFLTLDSEVPTLNPPHLSALMEEISHLTSLHPPSSS